MFRKNTHASRNERAVYRFRKSLISERFNNAVEGQNVYRRGYDQPWIPSSADARCFPLVDYRDRLHFYCAGDGCCFPVVEGIGSITQHDPFEVVAF